MINEHFNYLPINSDYDSKKVLTDLAIGSILKGEKALINNIQYLYNEHYPIHNKLDYYNTEITPTGNDWTDCPTNKTINLNHIYFGKSIKRTISKVAKMSSHNISWVVFNKYSQQVFKDCWLYKIIGSANGLPYYSTLNRNELVSIAFQVFDDVSDCHDNHPQSNYWGINQGHFVLRNANILD